MPDPHRPWQQGQQDHHRRQQESPFSRAAANSVQDAQGLLTAYPMASVNPTNHVVRHLNSLNLTAEPPSFLQPSYYGGYPQASLPPPYTEYAQEIAYMGSRHVPPNDSGYWNQTRDQAACLLGNQAGCAYSYQDSPGWLPSPVQHSSFHTTPFAHSLFQQTMPAHSYPTPPPPGIINTSSSSSLAHALGPPPPPQPRKVYRPEESPAFFDSFLEQKSREMTRSSRPATPPPKSVHKPPQESPDPLALRPGAPIVTPLKRKVYVELASPAAKRVHYMKPVQQQLEWPVNSLTPTKTTTPFQATPTLRKVQKMAYVAVPNKPWLTPSPRKGLLPQKISEKRLGKMKVTAEDDEDDLGGYGTPDDDAYSPTRSETVKSSARRTGDRDDRAPLEKFTSLVEEIFEAEDALPADADLGDLPSEIFSLAITIDASRPVLNSNVIRKLTKNIGHIARPAKRLRQSTTAAQATPRGKGRMAAVETPILARLLKTLQRSVRAGEDIDPFHFAHPGRPIGVHVSPSKKSPKKQGRGKKHESHSKGSDNEEDEDVHAELDGLADLTEAEFDRLSKALEVARESIVAADCCIALLGSDRLQKQLYSEELITACLSTIKNQLTKIIYPFVEASTELASGTSMATAASFSPLLHHIVLQTSSVAQSHRRQLSEVFQAVSAVLPKINMLINAENVAMSDSIIIQAVYIAIGPFFVVESAGGDGEGTTTKSKKNADGNVVLKTFGKSAMRGLRLDALALIRSIFANHEDQRSWIIEEILSSLIKLSDTKQKAGQFRLRDGRSIRTVSALLLQLVQTSAHDVRLEAKRIDKARQNKFALKRQESMSDSQANLALSGQFLDDSDLEELRLYGSGLDSATKAAKTIILFLTQRSGKGKATKNSNEAEYRTILDNLISDLLAVLYWPEWPAASLLLSIACKFMVSSLDDVKVNATDNNAAKTIALDHLGIIAARIRSSMIKVRSDVHESARKFKALKPLDEIVSTLDIKELEKLIRTHKDVAYHLCKRSSEDQAYDSARELTAATLGQELAVALRQVNSWITDPEGDEDLNLKDRSKLEQFGQKIKAALRDVWKEPAADVFDIGSQEEVSRIERLAEEIGTIQSLKSSFQPILTIILVALDAPAIFMRTKALRALGQIITSDATILGAPNVRRSIESHLLDNSPAVRDAAVELIGKYMIDSPEVAGDYYQRIADRIADTGLGVRKRVIKLLKSFYGVINDDNLRRIDIATRIVLRMLDEDESVRDLAIKSIEELWFPTASALPVAAKSRNAHSSSIQDKGPLLNKVAVIMGTSANFKDRQSPLEDMLHKIMADKSGADAASLHARYAEICETLIDGLVDASDLPGFTVINCIRTIYLFTSAYPAILSGSDASTLLPYLKNATTLEEQATSDYLLKVFRASIPHMPKTTAKFGHELQLALQPMIIKPNGSGIQVLQESVACMCIVVQNLTHDFTRLVNLLKSCNLRLQQAIKRPDSRAMSPSEAKALSILIFIVSLLGENCNFDNLRKDHPDLASEIDSISPGSITEHIYDSLLQLYTKYDSSSLRSRFLQCLGFLFCAQPTLMTLERSSMIMDAIFASPEEDARGRLLKIMQEFLLSESAKHTAKEKEAVKGNTRPSEVNMEELVGNTDGFADSGVSSAVVQRYLNPILDAALSQNPQIQAAAIDVLSFTIKQGLAHPLQSFPVIVALETSPNPSLSNRASALHTMLHNKHASLLNARFTVSARASFAYQKKVCQGTVRGFRLQPVPIALLQRWYSLVREKRTTRQDFLKALVKVFHENDALEATQDDIDFTRYMAENFAALDYKTQEEVITVIKNLTTILSTTGTQLLETVSPSHLLTHLNSTSPTSVPPQLTDVTDATIQRNDIEASEDLKVKIPLMRSSVIVAMVMLLKAHLKALYSLSEEKCNKFVLGKKSVVGDKPAIKRHENPINWDRLPFAMKPIVTSEDVTIQKSRFLDIWNEDGVTLEPEDEFL